MTGKKITAKSSVFFVFFFLSLEPHRAQELGIDRQRSICSLNPEGRAPRGPRHAAFIFSGPLPQPAAPSCPQTASSWRGKEREWPDPWALPAILGEVPSTFLKLLDS